MSPTISAKDLLAIEPIYLDRIIGGQNFKYDIEMGVTNGLPVPQRVLNTQLIAHLFDETKRKYKLNLLAKEMGERKLKDTIDSYMAAHGINIDATGHAQIPFEIERPYAIMDSVLVLRRLQWERQRWMALKDPRMMLIFQIDNACTPVYAEMEMAGMRIERSLH